jgi:hypothetical protein
MASFVRSTSLAACGLGNEPQILLLAYCDGRSRPEGVPSMCGIIGIVGRSEVVPRLIESLKRLEYRG